MSDVANADQLSVVSCAQDDPFILLRFGESAENCQGHLKCLIVV